ncbi:MAG: SpoIIE family protein phosphatase [Calditrichaeota bacterium]|nr:SpoIIE family protein phosphatase [Calditrichota bacterium]
MNELGQLRQKIKDLTSLIDVTSIITSTLDLDELMALVMEKAQEVMHAEASSIMLLNEDTGLLECQIALGKVQDKVKNKIQLKIGQGIAGWVAQTGESIIVPDVSSDSRFFSEIDQNTGFETRSILAAPLKVKNKVIGVAEVINRLDAHPFTKENLEIFETFCRQVALAIENARMHHYVLEQQRLRQQLESAHRIQQSFMPQSFPKGDQERFLIYGKNIPATAVGGDLFDFVLLDEDKLAIVIGDVSGKGIPAALFMARLISDFRYYCHLAESPANMMEFLNKALLKRSQRGMFVSLVSMVLDARAGKLTISNAGHLPPLWWREKEKRIERIENDSGIPLGILANANYDNEVVNLRPGDTILLYTDGVIEAHDAMNKMYTLDKLIDGIRAPIPSPQDFIERIIDDIKKFQGKVNQHDDITLLALRLQ